MSEELVAAIIRAAGPVLAALLGVLLWRKQVRSEAESARRLRRQRVVDMLVALRAEIAVTIERNALQFDPLVSGHAEARAIARLDDARVRSPETERDAPQGVAAEGNFVFSELKTDLDLLPEDVIDAVVRHYRFDGQLDALIRAFAAGVYENLSDVRQTEAVMAYFALGADTLDAALTAKRVVNAYLVSGAGMSDRWRSADDALQKRLSDQRNDRSGHQKSLQDHETYIVQKRRER